MSYVVLCLHLSRYVYICRAKSTNVAPLKIFSAVFVNALLHVLTLFGGRFPVPAASLRLSQRQIHAGHAAVGAPDVVFGRVWTVYVGACRVK